MLSFNAKRLCVKWVSSVFRVLSLGLVLSTLVVTFLTANSFNSFLKSNNKYDYIIGAGDKGSQLSLNSAYFIGTPKVTIGASYYDIVKDVKSLKSVVPIKQSDEYKGLQVIGTTREFFKGLGVQDGRLFSDKSNEIVVGNNVALAHNLIVGSKIKLTHRTLNRDGLIGEKVAGPDDGKPYPHKDEYTVVGVLSKSGTVYDNLLYMDIEDTHNLHAIGGTKDNDNKSNSILDDIDTNSISGVLVQTGGSVGLSDLQMLLQNDKAVSLYNLAESDALIKDIRGNISKVYIIVVVVMFILLSLIASLIHLDSVRGLKIDIKAMLSVKVPKSDIIMYTLMDNVIILVLSYVASYPMMNLLVKLLNVVFSRWSLIVNTGKAPIILMISLPVMLLYICLISFIVVDGVYEED